ncbi:MAG: NADH-quinone oxidoreductase subunit M [Polyangiaceae bacterium]|nr:NADH-quinone oxidoreductase subunit M [Polyangiaceae bacterium]
MNPLANLFFESFIYLAAFAVGAAIPRRHAWFERLSIGIVGALAVLLIKGLWPSAEAAPEQAATEWKHLLDFVVFFPIFSAIAVLFLPRQSPQLLKRFTLGVLAINGLVSLLLLKVPMSQGWHFQHVVEWVPSLGIRYHVAVDGVSLWLVLLSALTTPIAAYVSFGSLQGRAKDLCFSFLLLHGAMLGCFVALDLFLFFVFWELLLVPMLVMIGVWGGVERIKAAYKFFIYTMVGSMLMLAAILYLVWTHTQLAGYPSFDYLALSRVVLPKTASIFCFWAFAAAFVIKVPMVPFHTWLPDAHVQAPTGGSIVLAAILLKLGTYGYIRFCMGLFPSQAWMNGSTLAYVAVWGGVLGTALVAWKQDDVKRLVAYSSVAHMGFVMLGVFSASQSGMEGAILQMINHGISTGALFLLVGVIYDRRHTRLAREFGGLAKVMPVYAVLFIIVTMSSVGVPGTNGFVGEFMVLMGTFVSYGVGGNGFPLGGHARVLGVTAALGVILAALYMLSVVQKMFFGPITNQKNRGLSDINVRETVAVAPLIALIFVLGLFPNLFLSRITESVASGLHRFRTGFSAERAHWASSVDTPLLVPRRGGAFEQGYPEQPAPKGDTVAQAAPVAPAAPTGER